MNGMRPRYNRLDDIMADIQVSLVTDDVTFQDYIFNEYPLKFFPDQQFSRDLSDSPIHYWFSGLQFGALRPLLTHIQGNFALYLSDGKKDNRPLYVGASVPAEDRAWVTTRNGK